jgi:nitric oxide reductase activation protein
MKYIVFNNKKVDTGLYLQLQDISSVLTGIEDLKFRFDYGHYLDVKENVITASRFWDNLPKEEMEAGYKTDLYLRAVGTFKYTNRRAIRRYMERIADTPLRKFGIQLFTLLEDLRLEELCKKERPGMSRLFQIRRREFQKYFESQLKVNASRGYTIDELFCMLYLTVQSSSPELLFTYANDEQLLHFAEIKLFLYESFDTESTAAVAQVAEKIVMRLACYYSKDSINEYFILPFSHSNLQEEEIFDELRRKSKLKNEDQDANRHSGEEAKSDKLPTWHNETKSGEESRSFLQFELERGTKTELLGGAARETEDGDQAMGAVQGRAQASKNKDYAKTEVAEKQSGEHIGGKTDQYGEANRNAVLIINPAHPPSAEDNLLYKSFVQDVDAQIRRLSKTVEKTLEHKKSQPRKELRFGRLSKKLLPLVTDRFPKVFFKKDSQSKEIDAVFTLLVDCSASMHDKMDATKKGIILFHEVLKKLRIPHSITGFWEDANQVKDDYQPNYFHLIKDFQHSIYSKSGAEIMQLEPQEDNRDGFSIRVATEEMHKRTEKNKFLLIFSDGEPAAADYDQNGIVDTKEAVLEARKRGIEVIGMFLSNTEISEEDEKTMHNIYGREHLLVPVVEELPELFAPLLKKLLLKSM